MAYYTPGVLELIEALIDPSKTKQKCMAFLMAVPEEYVGQSYHDLAIFEMHKGAIPIGILRADKGPLPYVLSCTPSNKEIKLRAGDGLYVLGNPEWVHENMPVMMPDDDARSSPGEGTSANHSPTGNAIEIVTNPHSRASNPNMARVLQDAAVGSTYTAPSAEAVVAAQHNSTARV